MGFNDTIILLVIFFSMLCIIPISVSAATIHGTIYDLSLEQLSDVRMVIDTQPKQFFIAKNGTYEFNLPKGNYTINAYTLDSMSYEYVDVVDENGDYIMDFILSPTIDNPRLDITDNIPVSVKDPAYTPSRSTNDVSYMFIIFTLIIIFAILLVWIWSNKNKQIVIEGARTKPKTQSSDNDASYAKKTLALIKKDQRMTQKELRKALPLSESKISLIISELEHDGKIRKIKKGRGNILIFIKDY